MQKTLTYTLEKSKSKEIFNFLSNEGNVVSNASEYVEWSVKGGDWSALMYTSGKLVLQTSNEAFCDLIQEKFFEAISFESHIGSDEVGKGDYFGPLVVCACYIDSKDLEKIKGYGVVDSKKLTDEKMMQIGERLKEVLKYEVKVILPKEYNSLTEKYKNVSILLAKSHVEVIQKLFERVGDEAKFVVVDQFSKNQNRLKNEFKLKIPLKQFHHAESDIAVAAASIVARYFFLKEFEKMSKNYKMQFPLGATHVIDFAKDFVAKYGADELDNVAKVSFRTTQSVLTLF